MTSKKLNIQENVAKEAAMPATPAPHEIADRRALGKEKLKKFMDEELQMVRGIFQNFVTPGMALPLQIRKYPGHFFNQVLEDGKEYEVPLYVARHLNGIDASAEHINGQLGTCSYEVHSYLMDSAGNPIVNKAKRKRRFGFQSTQFAMGM